MKPTFSRVKQGTNETLLTFNDRFDEAADEAYPTPRQPWEENTCIVVDVY